MAIYKCSVCGYIFDEEKEGKKLTDLEGCPVCKQPIDKFELVEEDVQKEVPQNEKKAEKKNGFSKTLKTKVFPEIYGELLKLADGE